MDLSPWSGRELTADGSTVFPIRLVAPQAQSCVHSQQRGLPLFSLPGGSFPGARAVAPLSDLMNPLGEGPSLPY